MKAFAAFLSTLAAFIQMINANARARARQVEREDGRTLGRWEAADEAMREAMAFLGAAQSARRNLLRQLVADPDELRLPDEFWRGDASANADPAPAGTAGADRRDADAPADLPGVAADQLVDGRHGSDDP